MAIKICRYCDRTNNFCPCTNENCCNCQNLTKCVICCTNMAPWRIHPAISVMDGNKEFYRCRRCLALFEPSNKCICCNKANDRCEYCCVRFKHTCCKPQPIQFVGPGIAPTFFCPPLMGSEPRIKHLMLTRDSSLPVLNKEVKINPKHTIENKSTRFAAVEIEVSKIKNAKEVNMAVGKWACAVVHDRTTGETGFEINTSPACGDVLPEQLEELCDALVEGKAEVTGDCGLHVHVDCRDYGYQEIQRFVRFYHVIEPVLFAAIHPSRAENEFCHPCGNMYYDRFVRGIKPETKALKQALIPIVYGDKALVRRRGSSPSLPSFERIKQDHYGRINPDERNMARYSAINLHSYFLRGTIEFRMHHAAIDFIEVYGWARILVNLMDRIVSLPENKVTEILTIKYEIPGLRDMYSLHTLNLSNDVCVGLIVLSSLLSTKCFLHLLSKITLMLNPKCSERLPAQLFHSNRLGAKQSLSIEDSKLTLI